MTKYNIVMFAYNEQENITKSIKSVFDNTNTNLNTFYIIANGCSDNTVQVAEQAKQKLGFNNLTIINLTLGDKCNAWNHYMHELADEVDVHFFVDADVKFTSRAFPKMHEKLINTQEQTVIIAGMPQTGRNVEFYRSLVTERACFFGNLYGMKYSFIRRIREDKFHLPIGLNWIDSFLTKAVNTDLKFFNYNLPDRTTYIKDVGYYFDSLSPFKLADIKLYLNRIARYELGKIQEQYLDDMLVTDWPESMLEINLRIKNNFAQDTVTLSPIKKFLVEKRLKKLLARV